MSKFRIRRVLIAVTVVLASSLGAAKADPGGAPRWETFEDGSVSHGPDAAPVTIAGREIHRPFDPTTYDDQAFTADVEPDATTGTRRSPGLPTVHAIYFHPSDAESRFSEFAAMFQQDLRDAADLLASDYGRGLRIDERGSALGPLVDITVVKSTQTTAELAADDFIFSRVRSELIRTFKNPDKKYIVWVDVPFGTYCGQATLYQDTRRTRDNDNQRSSFAAIYRSEEGTGASGGFCRSSVVLHELGHALGALQEKAPHAFDGAHCNDSENDIMCYTALSRWAGATDAPDSEEDPVGFLTAVGEGARTEILDEGHVSNPAPALPVFDFNNDDYWDPAAVPGFVPTATATGRLAWWTANLSRFLCASTGCDKPADETGYDVSPTTGGGGRRNR